MSRDGETTMERIERTRPFVEWFERARIERDWSISEVARRIGVPPGTVSRWVGGSRPRPDYVRDLAVAFDADEDELLALAGHRSRVGTDDPAPLAHLFARMRRASLSEDNLALLASTVEKMRELQEGAQVREKKGSDGSR